MQNLTENISQGFCKLLQNSQGNSLQGKQILQIEKDITLINEL